ncbi:MAG TPA: Rho termination factor N-terminal domain-containing protein [Solirubrobacteraceae bacterium]|jgi:transcription termination factor Rho|nr:Rho termination factor N-terminal domain-containing protein [Solirubrobacteraceae bacterium]
MTAVLDRAELEASPLADLHAIADQLGLDGFRRLRKAELIDRIAGEEDAGARADKEDAAGKEDLAGEEISSEEERDGAERSARGRRRGGRSRRGGSGARSDDQPKPAARGRRGGSAAEEEREEERDGDDGETVEGVVEVLGNGSAFLRVDPPEPSDGDVYVSAAQVRRCELVTGDRVAGPMRTPRRSERYPSLVRVEQINGASADAVSAGTRYEDLPVDYPNERFALESNDPTLEAIEWLTPFGRGSRVVIVGLPRAGKSETLRALLGALSGREGLELSLVLAGVRPEEVARWQAEEPAPLAALSFAASPDAQAQAVERALDAAKRIASRGGDAVVLIDGLDALPPHAARKALAAARKLREGGSLTLIATAAQPFGGESTVIALDVALTSTGRQPILDLAASGTLRPDLLVGDDGAKAITKARAEA